MKNETYRGIKAALAGGWMLALLSGCGGGAGGGSSGDAAKTAPPDATARSAQRSESPVKVTMNGSQYTATQTVTLSNDTAQKSKAAVQFYTPVGSVASAPVSSSAVTLPGVGGIGGGMGTGYQIVVTLNGHGDTEQKARDALATMSVEHADSLTSDTLYLATNVHFASANSAQRDASIQAQLPATLAYRLAEGTQVGDASSTGLSGPSAELDAPVGSVSLDGTWPLASLTSDSGGVTFNGSTQSLQAYSSAGSVKATVTIQGDLQADLASRIGSVDVKLTAAATTTGYDLYADTDVGTASITVTGATAQGTPDSHHAHSRSANYDTASPKASVHGTSSVGSVTIHN